MHTCTKTINVHLNPKAPPPPAAAACLKIQCQLLLPCAPISHVLKASLLHNIPITQAPLRKKGSRGRSHMLGQNLIDDGVHGFCGSFSSQVCLFYFVCLLSDGFCNYKSLTGDVDVLGRDGFSALLQEFSIFTYGVPRRFRYLSSSDHGDFYL